MGVVVCDVGTKQWLFHVRVASLDQRFWEDRSWVRSLYTCAIETLRVLWVHYTSSERVINNNELMTSESRYLRILYYVSLILLNFMLGVRFPHKITLYRDPPSHVVSFILQVKIFLRITDWWQGFSALLLMRLVFMILNKGQRSIVSNIDMSYNV